MTRSLAHPWLDRFAWFTVFTTLALIGLGGLVTSKGAGMAVPDWPTTYGYNMFLFPVRLWMGGIFYEHTHRLVASFVGFLTTVLAIWIWVCEERRWLRWLGVVAFAAVVLQGVLGGLRVTLYRDEIGIVHAALAQSFLVLLTGMALFLSGTANRLIARVGSEGLSPLSRRLAVTATLCIFAQLILGAGMRHQHAGLAVPDFPLAYGRIWPPMDEVSIQRMNQRRTGIQEYKPITAGHLVLHMTHRAGAAAIFILIGWFGLNTRESWGKGHLLNRFAWVWFGMIAAQASLGAVTVWSNKAADIATAHVVLGAISFAFGVVISITVAGAAQVTERERSIVPNRAPHVCSGPTVAQVRPTTS